MKKMLPFLLLSVSVLSLIPVTITSTEATKERDVVYLTKDDVLPVGPMADQAVGNIFLNPSKDAYVIDGTVLDALDGYSLENYLVEGGTVLVKDKDATARQVKRKIDSSVADFDYSDMHDYVGFMLKRDGKDNRVFNVNLDYVARTNVEDEVDVAENVPTVELVDSLLDSGDKLNLVPERDSLGSDLAISVDLEEYEPQIVARGTLMTALFLYDDLDDYVATYMTDLSAYRVATVRDLTSGYIRTVYDQLSVVSVFPENKFFIYRYGVRIYSGYQFISATDLPSQVTSYNNIVGVPAFPYSVVTGQLPCSFPIFSDTLNQNVTNANDSGANRYWWSMPTGQYRGRPYNLSTSARIVTGNIQNATAFSVRMENLEVVQTLYLIFNTKYQIDLNHRHELKIVLNSDGSFYQQIITG